MKLNKILYLIFFATLLVLTGCSSSGGDDSPNPPPTGGTDDEPEVPDPAAATLVFPEDNTECNTGVVDPNNEAVSTVTFEWNAAQNANRYTVTVTNLNTGSSTFSNAETNSADITIDRSTPYSWFVTSRADGTTATADSDTFRFYNEGPGIENYAPFPAEAVSPFRGENLGATTAVTLEWSGGDIDNDITGYEVFFGTDATSLTSIASVAETSIADVGVTASTIYFWQVITTDSVGNTSTSELFQFRVN